MPGFNLLRNARAFFTTNVGATDGVIAASGHLATTTFELQLLAGFSFSQSTNSQAITVAEAGTAPARSQRSFNTSLAPVDFSFSTYVRPTGTTTITAEERVLWNALLSSQNIDTTGLTLGTISVFTRPASGDTVSITVGTGANFTGAGIGIGDVFTVAGVTGADAIEWNAPATLVSITTGTLASATAFVIKYLKAPVGTGTAPATPPTTGVKFFKGAVTQNLATGSEGAYMQIHSGGSNKNQLQKFGMIIVIDSVTYLIDNAAMDQLSIDFGLDGIATLAWTGKATALRPVAVATAVGGTFGGSISGAYTQKDTSAKYITNKLSTVTLNSGLRGLGTSTVYNVAITGGSISIANNINYVTPENLGVVNQAIGYYTGTRSISGSLTAYLKTGTNNTAQLLSDMLASASTTTEPKFMAEIQIGGIGNAVKVEVDLPAVTLQLPSIDAGGDILSTTINFTAQGFDGSTSATATAGQAAFDVEAANDLVVRYYSA